MSGEASATKPKRPSFTIEVAQTEEQTQACMDVRVEGKFCHSLPLADLTVSKNFTLAASLIAQSSSGSR